MVYDLLIRVTVFFSLVYGTFAHLLVLALLSGVRTSSLVLLRGNVREDSSILSGARCSLGVCARNRFPKES